MITNAELLADIRDFCRQAKIAETTFGRKSVNDGRVVDRIEAGRVTLRTVERVQQYIAENSKHQFRGKKQRQKCVA